MGQVTHMVLCAMLHPPTHLQGFLACSYVQF